MPPTRGVGQAARRAAIEPLGKSPSATLMSLSRMGVPPKKAAKTFIAPCRGNDRTAVPAPENVAAAGSGSSTAGQAALATSACLQDEGQPHPFQGHP